MRELIRCSSSGIFRIFRMCTIARNPLLAGYSEHSSKPAKIIFQCLKGFQRSTGHTKIMYRRKRNPQQAFSGCAGRVIFVGYKFLINKETIT